MEIKLVVGLGNPGAEYEKTYHNAGFLFINQISNIKNQNAKSKFKKANGFEYLDIDGLILTKPLAFMNESGTTVKKAVKYFNLKPEKLLVAHDDADIELGKYKISFGRGAAGHKGVQSIIDAIGSKDFWRLRIGIGENEKSKIKNKKYIRTKASKIVLKKIGKEDMKILEKTFADALNRKQWQN